MKPKLQIQILILNFTITVETMTNLRVDWAGLDLMKTGFFHLKKKQDN